MKKSTPMLKVQSLARDDAAAYIIADFGWGSVYPIVASISPIAHPKLPIVRRNFLPNLSVTKTEMKVKRKFTNIVANVKYGFKPLWASNITGA